MENHAWTFANIVDSTTGTIIACGENEREKYPEAKVLDMVCEFRDNVMVIRDVNSGNGKEFSYSSIGKDTNSMIYKLILEDGDNALEGMAVSGITEYAKGEYQQTLVIDLDGYALYFVERK